MNDEAVHLLLVRTHQDGTATPARVFNPGAASVFQHWRHADRRTNDQRRRKHLECLPRGKGWHGFHPVPRWGTEPNTVQIQLPEFAYLSGIPLYNNG
jgi:hypothetical protein